MVMIMIMIIIIIIMLFRYLDHPMTTSDTVFCNPPTQQCD